MPHVAVYQSGNTTSIGGASSGPNAHLGLSLLVFFCINPPFGKFTQGLFCRLTPPGGQFAYILLVWSLLT